MKKKRNECFVERTGDKEIKKYGKVEKRECECMTEESVNA